jgi:PPM family protein phosphatase
VSRIDPERVECASISDVGRQRASNQDAWSQGRTAAGAVWMMVADGMGGHAGGETASRIAVETVSACLDRDADPPGAALCRAFEAANRAVHEESERDPRVAGMGTTGVAVLLAPEGAFVANVGDSRAYRMRGGSFEQVSLDHSLVAELQRRGVLTAEEARFHPRRNEVLRSLGVEHEVHVDLHELDLLPGDLFLLCSDGLSGVVRDEEIAQVLRRSPPTEAARDLVALANERGGPDNITVALASVPGAAVARRLTPLAAAILVVASLLTLALLFGRLG